MSYHTTFNQSSMAKDLGLLALALLILFLVGMDGHPYAVPSEARYIEIPRQMVETGDWITPRLNGVKYFEKPPFFYWIQAAQIKFFGLGEFSGRLWTALTMLAICMVTGIAAYKKYGRWVGLLSPVVLASSVLGFVSSRVVLLDAPVSLFLTICLFSFWFASQIPPSRKRDALLATMYVAAALATLTKGLIGFVIPAMVIGSWIALTGRWKLLLHVRLIPGLLLFLLITAPWHYLAGQTTPEFYHFYFIHEHFERFLTKTHGRYQPPWFFFAVLIAGMLPWTVFLYQSIAPKIKSAWKERIQDGNDLYLLLWVALPFTFFSLSDSKLIPYILPIFPVLAIFVARYLVSQCQGVMATGFTRGVYAMAGLFILLAIFFPLTFVLGGKAAATVAPIKVGATVLSLLLFAMSLLLLSLIRRSASPSFLVKVICICAVVFVSVAAYIAPHAATRSALNTAKPFAQHLKPLLKKGDEVAVFNHYYQDLPVYLNRNVTVVNSFGEMSFGRSIEERTHKWMIDSDRFLERWSNGDHKIYLLLRKKDFRAHCPTYCPNASIVFDNGGRNILISNKPELSQ